MNSTRIQRLIHAPRPKVYRTLLDASNIAKWKVPDNMTCTVHEFDARVQGKIRVSLTYTDSNQPGKTSDHTDTYHGFFAELILNEKIVEFDEFETDDPALKGEMRITILLEDTKGGTLITAHHDQLPSGVSLEDNELGWKMALEKLALLLET